MEQGKNKLNKTKLNWKPKLCLLWVNRLMLFNSIRMEADTITNSQHEFYILHTSSNLSLATILPLHIHKFQVVPLHPITCQQLCLSFSAPNILTVIRST